jgi:hypothetical protein
MEIEQLKKLKKDQLIREAYDALKDAKANDWSAMQAIAEKEKIERSFLNKIDRMQEIINGLRDARQETLHALDAYKAIYSTHRFKGEEQRPPTEIEKLICHLDFVLRNKDRNPNNIGAF